MMLNVRDFPDQSQAFSCPLDLSGIRGYTVEPFPDPVAVEGVLLRRHDEVIVEYTARYELHAACSRCLTPLSEEKEATFSHRVAEALAQDAPEDLLEAPGGMLDMREAVLADLLFSLDPAPLCGDDCKGLCPWCGVDRNEYDCDCEERQKPVDPRFEALRKQMAEDN